MYTSSSDFFSDAFKQKAMVAIQKQIDKHTAMTEEEFVKAASNECNRYGLEQVKEFGLRWKLANQVYQSMVMCLEERIRKERGPGFMTEGEAWALEVMFMMPSCAYMFDVAAADGIKNAIFCDQWYMFEKQWD